MDPPTRSCFTRPLIGKLYPLKVSQLPTYKDVLSCILLDKIKKKLETGKDPSVKDIVKSVVTNVLEIYKKATIPAVSFKRCNELVLKYHTSYQNLMKNYKALPSSKSYQIKVNDFTTNSMRLFDFALCKCESFQACNCSKEKKVPILEREFLLDQRNERKMFIGAIDIKVSSVLQQRVTRKIKTAQYLNQKLDENNETDKQTVTAGSSSNTEEGDSSTGSEHEDYKPSLYYEESFSQPTSAKKKKLRTEKSKSLPCFAEACDRVGVSDRGAALLSSSLLEDMGLLEKSKENVIDRNKVRRERQKERAKYLDHKIENLESIYFDGKRDATLITEKVGAKTYKRKVNEEHISVITEPNSKYVGHFTPGTGTARSICSGLIKLFDEKATTLERVVAVGCDGTATNTGSKGEVPQFYGIF